MIFSTNLSSGVVIAGAYDDPAYSTGSFGQDNGPFKESSSRQGFFDESNIPQSDATILAPPPPPPAPVPLDGGTVALIMAGLALGGRKLYNTNKKKS